MNYRKIDPIQVLDDFPESLCEQIRSFNNLLIQDDYHRHSDLSFEEEGKFLDARNKLLRAKGVLLEACAKYYDQRAARKTREFWRATLKSTLTVGASAVYLIWQLWNLGWGVPAIAAMLVSLTLVAGALIYWITKD
jgi:hypothetical protein